MVGIYCIKNTITDSRYVGQSIHVELRKYEHLFSLRQGIHFNSHLQAAYNKYGESSFTFEVLEECAECDLSKREVFWIDRFGGYTSDKVYNLTPGGKANYGENNPRYGKHWSEEWKKAQSQRVKQYLSVPEHHPLYGVHPSAETIEKQRASHLGKRQTKESNEKRSNTLRRKYVSGEIIHPMLGKHHTEAAKEKLRSYKHPKHTIEQLQRMSEAHMGEHNSMWGKHHTAETCQKLSISHTGSKNNMYGKIRINNGIINSQIPKDAPIPPGFVIGMLPRKSKH